MENRIRLPKKTLIVSSWAPPAIAGSPSLLYNLFSRFHPDSYCIFTSNRNFKQPPGEPKGRVLPCQYYFFEDAPIFKRKLFDNSDSRDAPFFRRALRKLRRGTLKTFRALAMIRSGLAAVRAEKAECVLGASDYGPALLLTFAISRLSGKPYLLYLFDLYKTNSFTAPWNLIANFFETILLRSAKSVILLNEAMLEKYRARYGNRFSFDVIQNTGPAEINSFRPPQPLQPGKPPHVVFTGNIYWAQEEALKNIIAAITEFPQDIRLDIYSPNKAENLLRLAKESKNGERVSFLFAPFEELDMIRRGADMLFLPLAWHTPSKNIIETALPQKVTEYLLSGKPILVHAPPFSHLARYAKENGAGLVADTEDIGALQAAIRTLLTDKKLVAQMAERARETYAKWHDPAVNAARLASKIGSL